ncbi:hypothetical protein [Acidomonas methanolica]|uniref:hypothetical protein n=1 Tax=Acidomonas methanolica TaxID=437 RepID=UPI00211A5330|nr:hypothetical protein [Acidomonas methanolica]MCQ9156089.1 hypothetical protein [Acidomonas methanolica]
MSGGRDVAARLNGVLFPLGAGGAVLVSVLLAHACDFFLHEFAHSFTAWGLGWMADPLALAYGPPTIDNILMQQQIDDNVDYGPIFASGHGLQAALIAAAGPLLANGGAAILCDRLLLVLTRGTQTPGRGKILLLWSLTWVAAFNVFNVWSYAPIRALATHADMALLARGLGVPGWVLFPFVTGFALWLAIRFSCVSLPRVQSSFARRSWATARPGAGRWGRMFGPVVLAATVPFFSMSGLGGTYGLAAILMSYASLFFLVPALIMACWAASSPEPSENSVR